MILENTQVRILAVSCTKEQMIALGQKKPLKLLYPGINILSEDESKVYLDNDMVQIWIKLEWLKPPKIEDVEDTEEKIDEVTKEGVFSTSSVNVETAIGFIRKTFDVKMLTEWAEKETRVTVNRAIQSQINSINAKAKGEDIDE